LHKIFLGFSKKKKGSGLRSQQKYEKYIQNFIIKAEWKTPLGTPRYRWDVFIEIHIIYLPWK
jgi:hypothetical protein